MSNYILHETITPDNRDPPWINKDIKQLIWNKNPAYKSYIRNDKSLQFFIPFQFLQAKLSPLIEENPRINIIRIRFGILKTTVVFRKFCYFFKTTKNQSLKYLFDKIPTTRTTCRTRNNIGNVLRFNVKHTYFKNLFFPSTVIEWNNLDKNIRSSESLALFKKSILQFIRPTPNRTFNCHNPIGIKLITSLRLGLSHPMDYKFKHNFLI